MKLSDIIDVKKKEPTRDLTKHSENDLVSSIKKVIEGAHFNTLDFSLKSTDEDLGKGLLKFMYKNKKYKVTHDGAIHEGSLKIHEFEPSSDIHHHYSSALHYIMKYAKKEKPSSTGDAKKDD